MQAQDIGPDGSVSPNLWQRRCSFAPIPTLVTPADALVAHRESEVEVLPLLNRECSKESVPDSLRDLLSYDEYPSDKENHESIKNRRKSLSWDGRQPCRSPNILKEDRQPFAKLQVEAKPVLSLSWASSPHSDFESRTLGLPPPQRQVTSAMVHRIYSLRISRTIDPIALLTYLYGLFRGLYVCINLSMTCHQHDRRCMCRLTILILYSAS